MNNQIFYYLRDEKGKKQATVCLIKHGDNYSRGISLCSKLDQFNRDWGKGLAQERAYTGVAILTNAEKPLTEKQIRLGKKNKVYMGIGPIRGHGVSLSLNRVEKLIEPFYTVYNQLSSVGDEYGILYKTTTISYLQLSEYERKLINFKKGGEI
jgi:hypothetical protein